jgi:DNA-binding NtrC family response regulator
MLIGSNYTGTETLSERDIFYKVLYDLRKDLSDLKTIVFDMMQGSNPINSSEHHASFSTVASREEAMAQNPQNSYMPIVSQSSPTPPSSQYIDITEANHEPESLSLEDKEIELIRKSLKKHNGKRKRAAQELGISERTLYRKIKQYDLE